MRMFMYIEGLRKLLLRAVSMTLLECDVPGADVSTLLVSDRAEIEWKTDTRDENNRV